jgi:hypothetical protein
MNVKTGFLCHFFASDGKTRVENGLKAFTDWTRFAIATRFPSFSKGKISVASGAIFFKFFLRQDNIV